MGRFVVALVGLVVMLAACDAGSVTDTTVPDAGTAQTPDPTVVVVELFEYLITEDFAATSSVVDEERLAVLAAVEDSSADALIAFASQGLSETVRRNFWSSFAVSMPELIGAESPDVAAMLDRQFAIAGDRFAVVSVRVGPDMINGSFVVRLVDGQWLLDPIATFGGSFVAPLRLWLRAIPSEQLEEASAYPGRASGQLVGVVRPSEPRRRGWPHHHQ